MNLLITLYLGSVLLWSIILNFKLYGFIVKRYALEKKVGYSGIILSLIFAPAVLVFIPLATIITRKEVLMQNAEQKVNAEMEGLKKP